MDMKELSWHERGELWLRLGLRLVMLVVGLVLVVKLGPPVVALLLPFVLAFLVAWMVDPVVRFCQKKCKIPRKATSLVLILLGFVAVGALLWALVASAVGEISSLAANWDELVGKFQALLNDLGGFWNDLSAKLPASVNDTVNNFFTELMNWLKTAIPDFLTGALDGVTSVASGVPAFAVAALAFIMGSYFISADYPRLRYTFDNKLPEGPRFFFLAVRRAFSAGFGGYFKAELILSIGVFFILLVGFLLIGQEYGLLLAFLLAVLDFIPILGSGTAMVPWAIVDLFTGKVGHAVELMVIWGVVALFRRLGEPKVLGQQTGLSPILSLVSVFVGMQVGGVFGMILGPVLCLVVINVCRSGIFDNLLRDLKLAFGDVSAILRGGAPAQAENSEAKGSAPSDFDESSKNK